MKKLCVATAGVHPVALARGLVTHSSGCVLDVGGFNADTVRSHHEHVTIAFLSTYLACVSFPEGGRELGYSTYQNLVGTKQRFYQGLRLLFMCLATRKLPAACVLWEEYGIPAFLR